MEYRGRGVRRFPVAQLLKSRLICRSFIEYGRIAVRGSERRRTCATHLGFKEACPEGTTGLSTGFQPWEHAQSIRNPPERAADWNCSESMLINRSTKRRGTHLLSRPFRTRRLVGCSFPGLKPRTTPKCGSPGGSPYREPQTAEANCGRAKTSASSVEPLHKRLRQPENLTSALARKIFGLCGSRFFDQEKEYGTFSLEISINRSSRPWIQSP
jgi:hypothetical protein